MSILSSLNLKYSVVLLLSTIIMAGCSGSSSGESESVAESGVGNTTGVTNNAESELQDTQLADPLADQDSSGVSGNDNGNTGGSNDNDAPGAIQMGTPTDNVVVPAFTRVSFDVTVPVYVSNALQVGVVSNETNLSASWVVDESWAVSGDFATNTDHPVIITFYDRDGEIILGQHETRFFTGSNASETISIAANQFDTAQWDDDDDGVSNLSELIAGSNPVGDDLPSPIQNDLEMLPIKTFRISWQPVPGAEFYRVLENADGVSGFIQVGDDLEASVQHYDHRVALFARSNASYMVQACDAFMCSDSEARSFVGFLSEAVGYFKPSATGFNTFGEKVSLSADGSTLVVGAPGDGSPAMGINGDPTRPNPTSFGHSGAAYVFVRTVQGWARQAYIKASDSKGGTYFGRSISLSDDGNTLVVGASKLYIFLRNNGAWVESTTIDVFGKVSLSGDGNTLVVNNSVDKNVRVFVRRSGVWQQQATVTASGLHALINFGTSISLSRDGNTLSVGAINFSSRSEDAGAVYIFERTGENWQEKAVLRASNADIGDRFGHAATLSADGKALVVGAPDESSFASGVNGFEFDNTTVHSGAAYIFMNNSGNWEQQAYLKASNPNILDQFGGAVSISASGDTVAIAAKNEDSSAVGINGDDTDNSRDRPGAVYVFDRSSGVWQQQAYVKAKNTDGFAWFGESLSLSADGSALAVGAIYEKGGAIGIGGDHTDLTSGTSGAVYLY